jgi:hypothetical protein
MEFCADVTSLKDTAKRIQLKKDTWKTKKN